MTLSTPPLLDGRTFDDWREALVRRIPVHAPAWTDHNPSDPGIALVELFAWLANDLVYRINLVPERVRAQLLDLLGIPPRPATCARTIVSFSLGGGTGTRTLELGHDAAERRVELRSREGIPFQPTGSVAVLPGLECLAVIKERVVLRGDERLLADGIEDMRLLVDAHLRGDEAAPAETAEGAPSEPRVEPLEPTPEPSLEVVPYRTRRLLPPVAGALPRPLDLRKSVDGRLWVALVGPRTLATETDAARAERLELRREIAGREVSLGVRVDESVCGPAEPWCCDDCGTGEVKAEWEVSSGCFEHGRERIDELHYAAAPVERDATRGLRQSGVVRLRLPARHELIGVWNEASWDEDLDGAGSAPPLVDDAELAGRIVAWLRVRPPEGPRPCIHWVGLNAVEVEQAATAEPEALAQGEDRPGQIVTLRHTPVIADSLVLEVEAAAGAPRLWQRVPSLALSGPDDPHYTLDEASGRITFGDGIHGSMPRAGARIHAGSYRHGGGVGGNVPAGSIEQVARVPEGTRRARLRVTNPFAANGGRDAETLEEALARVPEALHHNGRAVAADDYRALAEQAPGACIGRVEVLARHKAPEHVDGVPGVITLVVVPAVDDTHPNEPVPDGATLAALCEWLAPRRTIGTELCLIPPEYVRVCVSVAIELEDCYGIQTVARWVELAVRQLLAPLPPYGPAGAGWPFGRAVRGREIAAAIERVEGVRAVHDVAVKRAGADKSKGAAGPGGKAPDPPPTTGVAFGPSAPPSPPRDFGDPCAGDPCAPPSPCPPGEDAVPLEKWQLPALMGIRVVEGCDSAPFGDGCECFEEPTEPSFIPVPVVQDEC
jgi:hypothetical protein